jgi:hypothetical protein
VCLARDPSTVLMEPLASLTALSDLRMSVYSNQDATLTLQLSELSALSNLQASYLLLDSTWKQLLRSSKCTCIAFIS